MDLTELKGALAREYLRVSYDSSGRAKSTNQQHADNDKAMSRNGLTLGEYYDDVSVSASRYSKKARGGYEELIEDLRTRAFGAKVLVLWESSRGSRRVGEWVTLIDLCEDNAVYIYVTTHSRFYDASNPRDRRSLQEDAVDSEYESAKMSHRIKRDLEAEAYEGKAPSRPAFGHPRRIQVDGERRWLDQAVIDRERKAVAGLYEGLLAGRKLVAMAAELHEQGFRSPRDNPITSHTVRHILYNPRNIAQRWFKGEYVADMGGEPIVSEEVYQAAVQVLQDPARRTNKKGTTLRWLGSGLFLCGTCDDGTWVRVTYASGRRKPGGGREQVRRYRCSVVGHNNREAEPIEQYVLQYVAEILRTRTVAQLLGDSADSETLQELHNDATALRHKLDNLGAEYAEGVLTRGQLKTATDRLKARLAEIDEQLADAGRNNALVELLREANPADRFLNAELDRQRTFIDSVCSVTILPNLSGRHYTGTVADNLRITLRSAE